MRATPEVLQQHGDTLAELGFTLEPFGRSDYILRGVPAQIDAGDALPALEEICAQLRHGAHTDAQAVRDEVLKTVACKAAIKAGWQTEPEELAASGGRGVRGRGEILARTDAPSP